MGADTKDAPASGEPAAETTGTKKDAKHLKKQGKYRHRHRLVKEGKEVRKHRKHRVNKHTEEGPSATASATEAAPTPVASA